ncbi:HAD-IC family P-type ATPase [Patescibacteria group bacterium]|nr:HAD-IC family P-type ATPase [Patescibacteria group bacterium]
MSSKEIIWHNSSCVQTLQELKSSEDGLLFDEVKKRLIKYGRNELPRKKSITKLELIIDQFKSVLIYVLLFAGLFSLLFGEIVDAWVIFAAILMNAIVGFIQENKAQKALKKLRETISPQAKVLREGKGQEIPTKDLVPGDIIMIQAGDKVPADARILEEKDLETIEASLTGEPQTIQKDKEILEKGTVLAERKNMLYMGTIISRGRGKAVVVATGINTQIGQIAKLVSEIKEELTPLQKNLNSFSKNLSLIILSLCLVILITGLIRGNEFAIMFNTAVAVAVSAIPEGLAVAVTVILAIGMQRILKKKALVRKLLAAETLGSITLICTDKTGTLTIGEMRVVEVVTSSYQINVITGTPKISQAGLEEGFDLIKIGMLCNDAIVQEENQDLTATQVLGSGTEKALMLAGMQIGMKLSDLNKQYPRLDEILFDSEKKYMATLHPLDKEHNLIYFKGAPELIIDSATHVQVGGRAERITQQKRKELSQRFQKLSKEGLRVLAFAYREISKKVTDFESLEKPLEKVTLVGFIGIKDPLRDDVKETLVLIKKAGIKIVIITGDNKLTAKAIAQELELNIKDENILEGSQMSKLTDEELEKKVKDIKIYARVTPKDKFRIVQAWQKCGEAVAMTGDGINDAPALKQADIGVALGSGSEVAKQTANLVLLDNHIKTIAAAIEQGRVIYDNIKKVILYLLSDSFSEVIIIFGSLFFGFPLPLLPAQILWINLITDGFPSIALTVEPGEKELMSESPERRKRPILDTERRILIMVISLVTGLSSLGLFYYYWKFVGDIDLARTVAFTVLGIDSLLYVFSCRTLRHSIFHSHFFRNKPLLLGVLAGASLQLIAIYSPIFQNILRTVPLSLNEWSLILMVSFAVILVIELIKWIFITLRRSKTDK